MKFPFVVVLLYSASCFSPFVSENEIAEKVEITDERSTNLEEFSGIVLEDDQGVHHKNYLLKELKAGIPSTFIKTAYFKLYILHSSLMIDRLLTSLWLKTIC